MDTMAAQNTEVVESRGPIEIHRVYRFLGRCFGYPEGEFCEVMSDKRTGEELKVLVEGLPFEVNFRGIPFPSLPQDEFETAYINSFDITPPCPLYEYDYRRGELTRRDILEELFRFYEHFDIKLSEREKDYPDHLVAELEFMAFLLTKEADSKARGKDPGPYRHAQRDFLERHLNKWVPQLDERIRKIIKEPFYKGASIFMVEFIGNYLSYLKSLNENLAVSEGEMPV